MIHKKDSNVANDNFREREQKTVINKKTVSSLKDKTLNHTAEVTDSFNNGNSKSKKKIPSQVTDPTKKLVEQAQEELEKENEGVMVANQYINHSSPIAYKVTKGTYHVAKNTPKYVIDKGANLQQKFRKSNQLKRSANNVLQKEQEQKVKHFQKDHFEKEKSFKVEKNSSLQKELSNKKLKVEKIKLLKKEGKKDQKISLEKTPILEKEKPKTNQLIKKKQMQLHKKKLANKNLTLQKENPLIKGSKNKVSVLKRTSGLSANLSNKGITGVKGGLNKVDETLLSSNETDESIRSLGKTTKLSKAGTKNVNRAAKKLKSTTSKFDSSKSKLGTSKTKAKKLEVRKFNNLKVDQQAKAKLKKKVMKKKIRLLDKKKKKPIIAITDISSSLKNMFSKLSKINFKAIKKFIMGKVALMLGGSLPAILPFFIVGALSLIIVGMLGASTSPQEEPNSAEVGEAKNLSPDVEKWRDLVTKEAQAQGMESYVGLLLAIIQIESGGKGTRDIMQSSESAGHPVNYFQTEEQSVRQGVTHLKSIVKILKGFNKGYESNSRLLAQAYNFGSAFATYVGKQGGDYTLEVAENYSKTVVAPSLGNMTGITIPYVNATSVRLNKTYRYVNGGNFLYGELVGEYLGGVGGNGSYVLPIDNANITSPFGGRTDPLTGSSGAFHRGLDFGHPTGTPIKAIQDGKVITSGSHYSWGNHIVIQHSDGRLSLYAHQSKLIAKVGDTVTSGQVIGLVGSTGDSTGPHLHLEIAKSNNLSEGNLLDPAVVLGIK